MGSTFDVVSAVAAGIALSAVAGLRAFLPLLGLGAAARLGYVPLASGFEWIASDVALFIFGTATLIECIGDKVPALDHALDVLGTVLRPAAGVVVTAGLLGPLPPLAQALLAISVGAGVAGVAHVAKAKTRVGSSLLSFGFANPVLSLLEDFAAFGLLLLALVAPILAICMLAAMTLVAFLLLRAGLRTMRRTRQGVPA